MIVRVKLHGDKAPDYEEELIKKQAFQILT